MKYYITANPLKYRLNVSIRIFLFGPSCSGKSTLGKGLQKSFGDPWSYLDRDDLIEQSGCNDAEADALLDKKIESLKDKIIIDAQIPWREKKQESFTFSFFLRLRFY